MSKQVAVTWSTGCLCELSPAYMPLNNHLHGFAIVEAGRDGSFQVQNFGVDRGKVYRK